MLCEDILEEYVALNTITTSLPKKDIPISGVLGFARVEEFNTRIIFLDTGLQIRIPNHWITFFSGLASWGYERLAESPVKDVADLCYGIAFTSIIDFSAVKKIFQLDLSEIRKWATERGLEGFGPIEIIAVNSIKEI